MASGPPSRRGPARDLKRGPEERPERWRVRWWRVERVKQGRHQVDEGGGSTRLYQCVCGLGLKL
ncbi:hypothetical protein E2C01_085764 [Portunus trituberculatus]|uniref:Uncharacterized protein n=1 Tax=Portunus trituberculatus TaxID=210409 RepID=A0A5B7J7Q9_PORTR|nr:hypothetical protein [Portunus trituberculatus]